MKGMGNAKSMATGGINSAVGPLLMRKIAPLAVQGQNIVVSEQNFYRDRLFGSAAKQLRNLSFHTAAATVLKGTNESAHTVAAMLGQAVAHGAQKR